jgi:SOS response regulatory protein OraA/RecX
VIKQAIGEEVATTKEQRALVYRGLTEVKNRKRGDNTSVSLKELRKQLEVKAISNEVLEAALAEL